MQPDDRQLPADSAESSNASMARDFSDSHDAAARITREKIDKIYDSQAESEQPDKSTPTESTNSSPYHQTHSEAHDTNAAQWQQYHSAWQDYYQKYYERYYVGAVRQAHQAYQQQAAELQSKPVPEPEDGTISQDEALQDLRARLLNTVQESAKKVRKSRHFIPAVTALCVMLLFAFLQYNSIIFSYAAAYVSPGNVDPQNIIVDPSLSLSVDPAPRLIIPKINVDIPVDYNAKSDYDSQMAAMKSSVAFFGIPGANSKPGELGNVPIAGHSSNDFTDTGEAKFVFARLDQLKKDDTFYLNYNGTRYTYTVTKTIIVKPNEVSVLNVGTDKPVATLITCTPLGTAEKRLLVFGEQISPSPSTAKANQGGSTTTATTQMAGTAPTLIERIFGAH